MKLDIVVVVFGKSQYDPISHDDRSRWISSGQQCTALHAPREKEKHASSLR